MRALGREEVDVRAPGISVALSAKECWQLYVWLGASAPFVRNQLSVIRQGGGRAVSLSTPEERSQVLAAIASGDPAPKALSDGLRSLRIALAESER